MRLRRLIAAGLGVVAVSAASLTGVVNPPTAAHAATAGLPNWAPGTRVRMMTYGSNLCVLGARNTAYLQRCYPNKANTWKVRAVTTVTLAQKFTAYQFSNGNGLCLAPAGTSNGSGTRVVGVTCAKAATHHRQVWILMNAITDSPVVPYFLANGQSGLYMCAKRNNFIGSWLYEYNINKAPSTFGLIFTGKY